VKTLTPVGSSCIVSMDTTSVDLRIFTGQGVICLRPSPSELHELATALLLAHIEQRMLETGSDSYVQISICGTSFVVERKDFE
jgi:hypothetical protein